MKNHLLILLGLSYFLSINPIIAQSDSSSINPISLMSFQPYIDSLINAQMEEYKIPGVVISIIKDSSEIFTKGYGYADLENQIPIDQENTIFRIASVTKTFTATASMQLVEEGKMDLHADIRNYLPDDNFEFLANEPITMHQLLTHTAGFDITDTGDASLTPEDVIPLEELARHHMPDQVNTPGEVFSYSNFGYALAGFLIQEVSGMSYEEYIQTKILKPLDMTHTGINQPLPPQLKKNLSKSYIWDGNQIPLTRDYTNTLPGGGIISSGQDMTHYMLMHLNGGQYEDDSIISPESYQALTTKQYGSKNTKYGICYAFTENIWSGNRSIEHTGAQLGFLSMMLLIPEKGFGLFISQNNRKDTGGFRFDIARALIDTIVGPNVRTIESLKPPKDFDVIANNYTGIFRQSNYPHNTFEKVSQLFGIFANESRVEYNGDGRLMIWGRPYLHIEDHSFQADSPTSNHKVEFLVDDKGKAETLFSGIYKYEKTSWYQRKTPKQLAMIFGMAILLILTLTRPVQYIWKKVKGRSSVSSSSWISHWQYWTGSLFVLGAIGVILIFLIYEDQISDYGIPLVLKLVLLINTLGFIAALFSPLVLWKEISSNKKIIHKIGSITITISIILVAIVLFNVRMVGFQYY